MLDTGYECQKVWRQMSEDRLQNLNRRNSANRIEYQVRPAGIRRAIDDCCCNQGAERLRVAGCGLRDENEKYLIDAQNAKS